MADRCFVMQPFDGGKFDDRYDEIFAPAIVDAGLDPYRVDRDPAATDLIEFIESGIRNARICLAEISTDNPNVWYELGFAFGIGRDVVLVSEPRPKFPFDIAHRAVIVNPVVSGKNREKLNRDIAAKLRALMKKPALLPKVSPKNIGVMEGLSPHEIAALKSIKINGFLTSFGVSSDRIARDMVAAGYEKIAAAIAIDSLMKRKMISSFSYEDEYQKPQLAYEVIDAGEEWIHSNLDKLELVNPGEEIPF